MSEAMTLITHFKQMTVSNTTVNKKDFKTLVGTVVVSALLPLSLVLGATAINADSAEAYSTCRTSCYGNTCNTSCY